MPCAGSRGETTKAAQSCPQGQSPPQLLSALHWIINQSLERPSDSDQNLEKSLDKREAKGNFIIRTRSCKDEMVNGE